MAVRTTVVVVTWRGAEHVGQCLAALDAQTREHTLLVVDNASDDGTAALIEGRTVLRLHRNAGYAGGLARAMSMVDTPYVAWLNDDAEPAPGWLAALEDALDNHPRAAAASARLEHADGTVQSVGVGLTRLGYGADLVDGLADGTVFGFCGGAALLRVDALTQVGGVPAEFFCYYEDTDTSWRLRLAAWDVLAVPEAVVRHKHGATTRPGSRQFHLWNERNRLRMLLRCAPRLIALRELARFAVITALLPFRPGDQPPNYRVALRLQALAGALPYLFRRPQPGPRGAVWRHWAGTDRNSSNSTL
nr:glycosyltransferase family 2 protein [Labedaea rhizosphaerae]